MPEQPDLLERAGRALRAMEPADDLWARATRSTATDASTDVVALAPVRARGSQWRWVAAAAVVALLVGTLVTIARLGDDSEGLDTVPADGRRNTGTAVITDTTILVGDEPVTTEQIGRYTVYATDCPFMFEGEAPEPIHVAQRQPTFGATTPMGGPIGDGQTFVLEPGGMGGHVVSGDRSRVIVGPTPALVFENEVLSRVEVSGNDRGVCDGSFAIEVSGAAPDQNTEAAVDLARRVIGGSFRLLQMNLSERSWVATAARRIPLDLTEAAPNPPEALPTAGLRVDFAGGTISWDDGCRSSSAPVEWKDNPRYEGVLTGLYLLEVGPVTTDDAPCPSGVEPNDALDTLLLGDAEIVLTADDETQPFDGFTLMGNGVRVDLTAQ